MRLASIALTSFRSAENLELGRPVPVIYICGRNGVGKSSVREGIRWALRGVCSATDKKGQGWEMLVAPRQTRVAAGVVVEGLGGIARTYNISEGRHLAIEGRNGDMASIQAAVYEVLQTTPEFLDACLETSYFLDLHHADSKAFILGLLNVRIPYGKEELTLDQVDAKHDIAYKDRTTAKALLKAHRVPPRPASSWGEMVASVSEVETRLAGLRFELRELERNADTSKGKREALQARLKDLRWELTQHKTAPPPPPDLVPSLEKKVQTLTEEVAKIQAQVQAQRHAAAPPPPPDSDPETIIAALSAHKSKNGCVLDSGVECRTPTIVFTNRVKWYREQPQVATEKPLPTPQEAPGAPIAELVDARTKLAAARDWTAGYRAAQALLETRQSEADAITAQIASLPIGSDPTDMTQVDALRARVTKGEIVLDQIKGYWREMDAHTKGLQKQAQLQGEVDRLEALVADLGPNGIRVQVLEKSVGSFEAAINQTTNLFGWAVKFQISPWEVLVNDRPLEAYSESERFRIGIAVQIAVAHTSGLKFIVVDRLDMLDRQNRGEVTGLLIQSAQGLLEQVVILSTREDDQPLPAINGVAGYRLTKNEQGQTTIAESK